MAESDRFLPVADESVAEHVIVAADPARTYEAIGRADVAADRVLGLGALPARVAGQEPGSRTLDDLLATGVGPVELESVPGVRRVIALAGRYGFADRGIERLEPGQFAAFEEPGSLKAVAIFALEPQPDGRTLLGCEVRIRATDEDTRSTLQTMWFAAGPGLRMLVRRLLERVRTTAEA